MSTISAKKLQIRHRNLCEPAPNAHQPGDLTFPERLMALRGTMTYRQFAARVGSNACAVRRYEQGKARVPLDYAVAVCAAFTVSADWLIFGVEVYTLTIFRGLESRYTFLHQLPSIGTLTISVPWETTRG